MSGAGTGLVAPKVPGHRTHPNWTVLWFGLFRMVWLLALGLGVGSVWLGFLLGLGFSLGFSLVSFRRSVSSASSSFSVLHKFLASF